MELEKLFLTEKELPILYKTAFQIPVHPKLLDKTLKINPLLASKAFFQLQKSKNIKDVLESGVTFMPNGLVESFYINNEEDINFMENGLVSNLSINRNAGGSLYFNKEKLNCKSYAKTFINFSEEKLEEFLIDNEKKNIFVYSGKNIDTLPKALFLRNWAIEYMNEVFKQVF